jgi:hypothetical protein
LIDIPVLATAVPQRDNAPASAIVRWAHHLSRELLALRSTFGVGHEAAAVVVDDVVLVLAGHANAGVGDGEHVVIVHIVDPACKLLSAWCSCAECFWLTRYLPAENLRSVGFVSTGQRHAAASLAAGFDAVEAGSVPVRHGGMVGRGWKEDLLVVLV